MEIYPAIDLYEGKVVRLEKGDYRKCKVYGEDPGTIAKNWIQAGARWLHVVDLEGARAGEIRNWTSLEKILSQKGASIQFGGGVRQQEDIQRLLDAGVQRVILGTKALDWDFAEKASQTFGERLAVSLDVRGTEVQVEGWLRGSGKTVFEVFRELNRFSFRCAVVTDIAQDGTLGGVNLQKIRQLLEAAPFPLILSGGVASVEDIRALFLLQSRRLDGVIVGKALYEKRVDLGEALAAAGAK